MQRRFLRPWQVTAGLLLLVGCHLDTTEDPAFRPMMLSPQAGPLAEMPTARPTPVATPGPPPQGSQDESLVCEDGQIAVPGQWAYADRWRWQAGYCVLDRAGYAYIPPVYERGLYVAGYFAAQHEAGRIGPVYRRFEHPPGMELAPPRPEAAPAPVQVQAQQPAQAQQSPLWVTPYGAYNNTYLNPRRTAPRPPRSRPAPLRTGDLLDPGRGERPRPMPPGWGERP